MKIDNGNLCSWIKFISTKAPTIYTIYYNVRAVVDLTAFGTRRNFYYLYVSFVSCRYLFKFGRKQLLDLTTVRMNLVCVDHNV